MPKFPLFAKSPVNGEGENKIYTFLKGVCDPPKQEFTERKKLLYDPLHGNDIRWNFEKFLIAKNGKPYRRFAEFVKPEELVDDIQFLLFKRAPRGRGHRLPGGYVRGGEITNFYS